MPKQIEFTKLNGAQFHISFNRGAAGKYTPIHIQCLASVEADNGMGQTYHSEIGFGGEKNQPETPRQLYARINAFSPQLANLFKNMYQEAINEDPAA